MGSHRGIERVGSLVSLFTALGYEGSHERAARIAEICINEELYILRDFNGLPDLKKCRRSLFAL